VTSSVSGPALPYTDDAGPLAILRRCVWAGSHGRSGDPLRTERGPSPLAAEAQVWQAVCGQVSRSQQSRARWRKSRGRVVSAAAGGHGIAEIDTAHVS